MLISPGQLTLDILKSIHAGGVALTLPASTKDAICASAEIVQRAADGDVPVYGVNTGFGKLANQRIANTAHILGIELLAAAQGIEFLRPVRTSIAFERAHALLRKSVPALTQDRHLSPDIEYATQLVRNGSIPHVLRALPDLPPLWSLPAKWAAPQFASRKS